MGGSTSNEGILFIKRPNNDGSFYSVNSNLLQSNTNTTQGLISVSSDGTTATLRQGTTTLETETISTQFKSSQSVFLLVRNSNGNPLSSQFSNATISISFIADELTVSELGILETAIETFLNAI